MATVPTSRPTTCVVHYEDNSDDAEVRQLWIKQELLENARQQRNLMKVQIPNLKLSRSWDERLATPHRCSSFRLPPHPPATGGKYVSSCPNSRHIKTRQDFQLPRRLSRTAGEVPVPLIHALGTGPGDTSLTSNAEFLENPSWNAHLNAWVSCRLGNNKNYITFAGKTELIDRGIYHFLPEFHERPMSPCPRYLEHMHKQPVLEPIQTGKGRRKLTKKPKFWKWKGRTARNSAMGDENVTNPSLPPLHSTPDDPSKPALSRSSSSSSFSTTLLSPTPTPLPTPLPDTEISHEYLQSEISCPETPSQSPINLPTEFDDSIPSHTPPLQTEITNLLHDYKTTSEQTTPGCGPVGSFLTPGLTPQSLSPFSPLQSGFPSPSLLPYVGSVTPQSRMSPEMKIDSSQGEKPPIEFYQLTDPPKTASSMDWETGSNFADFDDEDAIILGVSPSHLKRMFFSNDYFEVLEVPMFGHVELMSYDLYKGVTLVPGLQVTAGQKVNIQPPDRLLIADMVALHSPPPAPIPVPKIPSLPPTPEPTPPPPPISSPPAKDPTPPPPPVSKPKQKPIVKKKKAPPAPKVKKKTVEDEVIPSAPEPSLSPPEPGPDEPLPDVVEEEEPVPTPAPVKLISPPPTEIPTPRPPPPRLNSPPSSPELEAIQEENELEIEDKSCQEVDETWQGFKDETKPIEEDENIPSAPVSPVVEVNEPIEPPVLPILNVESPESEIQSDPEDLAEGTTTEPEPLPEPVKDPTFVAEQERERLAEERRRKAFDMFERLKSKQFLPKTNKSSPSIITFTDEGWLAQFCIIKDDKAKMYQQVFSIVDEDNDGYLSCFETLMALKGISGAQKLTKKEEAYVVRVLELADYSISQGTDLKLFSVLAALSQQIVSIDSWVRNLINSLDLTTLEWKITKGKELFEWCVDEDTRQLQLDRLLVELKAGGISEHHQEEVRLTLSSKASWDLIDFLSYLPLFIMTHQSVVSNPLDDSREK